MFVNPKLILFYELKTDTLGTETTFNMAMLYLTVGEFITD